MFPQVFLLLIYEQGGVYYYMVPLSSLAYPLPLNYGGPLPRILPYIWHFDRGKKGGQSPLSSIIFLKQKRGHIFKKYFWKNFKKIGVFIC